MRQDYFQGDHKETSLLQLQLEPGEKEMRLQLKGDPVIVSKMIAHGMQAKKEIAAAFIAGVLSWCKENKIHPDDLKYMVEFH